MLTCLKDRNYIIYEWVLGSHFGSLIDLEQEMGQWSPMLRSGTLTSVITSGLFVYIRSIRVADVCVIDDSTPVGQSRHTLRFQSIACRSIMRCPRVLTRPEMIWQAFVPDIASGQLAVFDMAEKQQQENGIVAMASVSQTNDTLSNVQVSHSSRFRSQKQG